MTLEISNGETGPVVRPIGSEDAAPQNIRFALSEPAERKAFEDFLEAIQPSGFEIIDPAGIPTALLDTLIDSGIPYDVFIADAGLFFGPGEPILPGAISDTKAKPRLDHRSKSCADWPRVPITCCFPAQWRRRSHRGTCPRIN